MRIKLIKTRWYFEDRPWILYHFKIIFQFFHSYCKDYLLKIESIEFWLQKKVPFLQPITKYIETTIFVILFRQIFPYLLFQSWLSLNICTRFLWIKVPSFQDSCEVLEILETCQRESCQLSAHWHNVNFNSIFSHHLSVCVYTKEVYFLHFYTVDWLNSKIFYFGLKLNEKLVWAINQREVI